MKTYHYTVSRGADVEYGESQGESLEEVTSRLRVVFEPRYDLYDIHEATPSPRRPYDDHDAKLRASEAMIEAMRPTGDYSDY